MSDKKSQDQFIVRLPDGMRDRIKAKAEKNGRSMNAEIVEALEHYFPPPTEPKDVVRDVLSVLSYVEPGLREDAIKLLAEQAADGRLSTYAEAYAYADRDSRHSFPWEED